MSVDLNIVLPWSVKTSNIFKLSCFVEHTANTRKIGKMYKEGGSVKMASFEKDIVSGIELGIDHKESTGPGFSK